MSNLNEFINESKTRLQVILNQLNWTSVGVVNANKNSLSKDTETSYDGELLFPPSCASQNSVVLDTNDLCKLLNKTTTAPQGFSDLQTNFTREEKALLYEHVQSRIETKISLLDGDSDLVSIADIVAMKKREKKNRRKHRVSKPTHTEELRSLVELQMQSLEQHLKSKYASDDSRDRRQHDIKNTIKKEPENYAQDKHFTRNRSKERQQSYSYERRRNKSKDRYHSKHKYNEDCTSRFERPTRDKNLRKRSRSRSEHRRSRSRSKIGKSSGNSNIKNTIKIEPETLKSFQNIECRERMYHRDKSYYETEKNYAHDNKYFARSKERQQSYSSERSLCDYERRRNKSKDRYHSKHKYDADYASHSERPSRNKSLKRSRSRHRRSRSSNNIGKSCSNSKHRSRSRDKRKNRSRSKHRSGSAHKSQSRNKHRRSRSRSHSRSKIKKM